MWRGDGGNVWFVGRWKKRQAFPVRRSFCPFENLSFRISDSLDIVIHQMPANVAAKESLYCRELLAVLPKKSSGQS